MRSLTDYERMHLINHRMPSANFSFPASDYTDSRRGSKSTKRYCNHNYFTTYPTLTYSFKDDSIYCLPCALFPSAVTNNTPANLVTKGFRNWKKVKEVVVRHLEDKTGTHSFAVSRMENFVKIQDQSCESVAINRVVDKCYSKEVENNRNALHSIIKSLIFCGRQGLALRGHRDSGQLDLDILDADVNDEEAICLSSQSEHNHGNFRSLLQFRVESGDVTLQKHFAKAGSRATYISSYTQNELLECIHQDLLQQLQDDMTKQNGKTMYSVLADEVTDNQNISQLGISIRYVDKSNTIKEMCIGFSPLSSMTGESVAAEMISAVSRLGLDVSDTIGLGLDGAGNMSGQFLSHDVLGHV